jgi:hypothetical protein
VDTILYGIGQWSCSSPLLWAPLNQLIITALGEKFDCIKLVSVDNSMTSTRPCDSFVDDTTTGVTSDDTAREPVPLEETDLTADDAELINQMQVVIQFFLDLLQVTGGDLAPKKCVWYLIAHRWKTGVPRLLAKWANHRGIEITSNATGQTSEIKRKAVNQGHRTLGFHLTGDGISTAHKKIVKTKAKGYIEEIISSSLQRGESAMAYNLYYMASISYGTAATSLNIKECDKIQRQLVNAILPKMGIHRKTARAVVFGTTKYGVLGPEPLAAIQGFAQLQYLIGSLRTQDTTGDLYQMLLEYTQLECGTDTPILEAEFTTYEPTILTKKWITECWRYMSLCKSTVAITGLWATTEAREGDTALMDKFLKQDTTDAQMKDVNRCRIYLQVFHISDITDLSGNTIEEWAKRGKHQSNRTSKLNWPVQQRLLAGAWKKHSKALRWIMTTCTAVSGHGRRHRSCIKRQNGTWTQCHFHYSGTMKEYGRITGPLIMGASGLKSQERQQKHHDVLLTRQTAFNDDGT